jgi:hypothetical protein
MMGSRLRGNEHYMDTSPPEAENLGPSSIPAACPPKADRVEFLRSKNSDAIIRQRCRIMASLPGMFPGLPVYKKDARYARRLFRALKTFRVNRIILRVAGGYNVAVL